MIVKVVTVLLTFGSLPKLIMTMIFFLTKLCCVLGGMSYPVKGIRITTRIQSYPPPTAHASLKTDFSKSAALSI